MLVLSGTWENILPSEKFVNVKYKTNLYSAINRAASEALEKRVLLTSNLYQIILYLIYGLLAGSTSYIALLNCYGFSREISTHTREDGFNVLAHQIHSRHLHVDIGLHLRSLDRR